MSFLLTFPPGPSRLACAPRRARPASSKRGGAQAGSRPSITTRAGAGIIRSLLSVHFLGRSGDFGAALGLGTTQPQVRLVHDHHVMQQLLVDARRQLGRVDFVLAHLFATAIEYFQAGHGYLLS